jgi:putative endopeptidase
MVMAHELTHGFDDQGRKFDAGGRYVAWWPEGVSRAFDGQTACVADQYGRYEVAPGVALNGPLTLGENIADIGGVRLAFRGFQAEAARHPSAGPAVGDLTDDKLFFVAFAQGWCTVASPEYERSLVMSDPHSPPRFRVNGPLSNLAEFHGAFSCAAGTPMHPEKPCEVW